MPRVTGQKISLKNYYFSKNVFWRNIVLNYFENENSFVYRKIAVGNFASAIGSDVWRLPVVGVLKHSTDHTDKRLSEDTYFISEPQINVTKWPKYCARTMTRVL